MVICQIVLVGSDQKKIELGLTQLGVNKLILVTPNQDKYYIIAKSVLKKFDSVVDSYILPIMDSDSFNFIKEFKQVIAENFRKFEIKINASTEVRNWKMLSYFSVLHFYPILKELSNNRLMFYEVIGGESLKLSDVEYRIEMDEDSMRGMDSNPKVIEADKVKSKDVIKPEAKYFDDGWGKPGKRSTARIEIYPIETLTSLEQYIVDIISRQELRIEDINREYVIVTQMPKEKVTRGLLSRYLGNLKRAGIVYETGYEAHAKKFKLTEYGLKYVLPLAGRIEEKPKK
jgi:hypothetical protein